METLKLAALYVALWFTPPPSPPPRSRPALSAAHRLPGGTILPNHLGQSDLDDSVRSFYRQWKKHYILPGCTEGEAYVWFEGTKGSNICVSEGRDTV